jgi:2,4-dienoyl-CoA reductase-like NADH-dependent reductase (Old Yellow Enzyme family)
MVRRLGFDGLEIHAGHGYLIDQFFWRHTNRRGDVYGGDLVERTRFAVEVLRACRAAVGTGFPISLRISQWKIQDRDAVLANTPDEFDRFLAPLADAGVDLFHCSAQRYWEPAFAGSDLNLAGWVKKLTGSPAMSVGSVGLDKDVMDQDGYAYPAPIDRLLEMMARGDFDLVAVGRALIADPHWVEKIRRNAFKELRPFSYGEMSAME